MAHRFEVVLGGAFRAIDLLDRVTDEGGERSTSPQRGGIQGTPLLVGQRDLSSLHDVSLHHFLSGLEHLEAFPHVRRVRIRETTAHQDVITEVGLRVHRRPRRPGYKGPVRDRVMAPNDLLSPLEGSRRGEAAAVCRSWRLRPLAERLGLFRFRLGPRALLATRFSKLARTRKFLMTTAQTSITRFFVRPKQTAPTSPHVGRGRVLERGKAPFDRCAPCMGGPVGGARATLRSSGITRSDFA